MSEPSRYSETDVSGRDIPSFIEPRPPLVLNPFMRPKPQKGTNLLELFEEDSECEEPDLVQVYLRLKPCNRISNLYEIRSERCLITSLDTTTAGHGRRTQHNVSKMYTFSHIFKPDSSQKEIFDHVVKDNLKKLPEGHSFTLLTYGASGSGKTFTLMGTVASPGLVPRSLEYVFNSVEAAQRPQHKPSETGADILSKAEQDYELQWVKGLRQVSAPLREKYRRMSASLHNTISHSHLDLTNRTKHYVWVSFIEIYNEGIYDLLVPCDRRTASKLAIREDSSGNVYVKGATQAFVRSGEEAYDVMVAGKHNLQVAATGVHAQSSRSHCIFTITMLTEMEGEVRSGCVRLCDLAGCERAARTRNTGARMQESRAINSSLHVLERCLHTLRRRQAGRRALVPYRESKLTRLLGAGLSGARGEAVSMMVTLNPAPEYAHETRHVLQLAAVAKDIQVNNTIAEYPSSLETTQDTTLGPSTEVMKLRADNERLRFELVRSEAWYKEQLARMEEKQEATVGQCNTWALVEEAKQITKQYYEDRILNLRKQNEEMAEEQENKIAELLMNITVLEENLSAEKLARARAEEEVVHLRTCIEERDEKLNENERNKDVISVTDSENSDSESDSFNESLEPTFKREDINRSKQIRQSIEQEEIDFDSEKSLEASNESILEKLPDALKEQGSNNDSAVDSTYATGTEASDGNSNIVYQCESISEKTEAILNKNDISTEKDYTDQLKLKHSNKKSASSFSRSTYCVIKDNSLYESSAEFNNDEFDKIIKSNISNENEAAVKGEILKNNDSFKVPDRPFVYSIINSFKKPTENNNSLAQFESLERAAKDYNDTKQDVNVKFDNINILKERRHFFDDGENKSNDIHSASGLDKTSESKRSFFEDMPSKIKDEIHTNVRNMCYEFRSPSIVRDEDTNDFEQQKIKELLGESNIKPIEPSTSVKKSFFAKKHDSIDVFDSPQVLHNLEDQLPSIDDIRRSIAKVNISNKNKQNNQNDKLQNNILKVDNSHQESLDKSSIIKGNLQLNETTCEDFNKYMVKKSPEKVNNKEIGDLMKRSEDIRGLDITNVNVKVDNTLEEFESIYKEITIPRSTEFDLLFTQSQNETQLFTQCQNETQFNEYKSNNIEHDSIKTENCVYNLRHIEHESIKTENCKYNLRNKSKTEKKTRKTRPKCSGEEEILMESLAKCQTSAKPTRRNLRLRRRKNVLDDDSMELDKDDKLKDIANLQTEFSDITMDVPARTKVIKDIPSPEKQEEENVPPMLGIQSCPSKLSIRGRRKLFTPRAEPLDESVASDECDERIRVPRPSYHRPRARRKL